MARCTTRDRNRVNGADTIPSRRSNSGDSGRNQSPLAIRALGCGTHGHHRRKNALSGVRSNGTSVRSTRTSAHSKIRRSVRLFELHRVSMIRNHQLSRPYPTRLNRRARQFAHRDISAMTKLNTGGGICVGRRESARERYWDSLLPRVVPSPHAQIRGWASVVARDGFLVSACIDIR